MVTTTLTVAGTVETFDDAAFINATLSLVPSALDVEVDVAPASVRVTTRLIFASDTFAEAAAAYISNSTNSTLSASLGVVVQAVSAPVVSDELIDATSPPPPPAGGPLIVSVVVAICVPLVPLLLLTLALLYGQLRPQNGKKRTAASAAPVRAPVVLDHWNMEILKRDDRDGRPARDDSYDWSHVRRLFEQREAQLAHRERRPRARPAY